MQVRIGQLGDVQAYDELMPLMLMTVLHCHVSHRKLYRLTRQAVLQAILRVNRNRDDAAEILQDVYLTAWDKAASFDPEKGSVIAWLRTIAHRKAVSSLRHRSSRLRSTADQRPALEEEDAPTQAHRDEGPGPCEIVRMSRAALALHRSIASLPPNMGTSITMAFFDDLTHNEIAGKLGRPLGTVKSWVRRSMEIMRPTLVGH